MATFSGTNWLLSNTFLKTRYYANSAMSKSDIFIIRSRRF